MGKKEKAPKMKRGERMVTTRNYQARNNTGIDEQLVKNRPADDLRLPMSELTYEEYLKAKEILDKCTALKEKMIAEGTYEAAHRLARIPGNPYYEIYCYLVGLKQEKIENGADPNVCVICGEDMKRSAKSKYPYCQDCARILLQGKLRGQDNTLGYLHWNKLCVVCHQRPADLNMRGMCRVCYRLGERHNTHDPKDVREIRRERLKKTIQEGEPIVKKAASAAVREITWTHKQWD